MGERVSVHLYTNWQFGNQIKIAKLKSYVMYDSYLLKDVHSVLVNFPREYAQESMMLYI